MNKTSKILIKKEKCCECCGSELELDIKKLLIDAKKAGIKVKGICKNCQNVEDITFTDIKAE